MTRQRRISGLLVTDTPVTVGVRRTRFFLIPLPHLVFFSFYALNIRVLLAEVTLEVSTDMDMRSTWIVAKAMNRKGLAGAAGAVIGVMIAIIVIVAVALPVTESIVNAATCANNSNTSQCTPTTTGTSATILELIPLFLGLAALVTVAALFA